MCALTMHNNNDHRPLNPQLPIGSATRSSIERPKLELASLGREGGPKRTEMRQGASTARLFSCGLLRWRPLLSRDRGILKQSER